MQAILVLGSNSGNRTKTIEDALAAIRKEADVLKMSIIYESPDCLGKDKPYLNTVISVETPYSESEFNNRLKTIEFIFGRNQEARNRGDVPLDIDIVIWDGKIRRPLDYRSQYFQKGYKLLNT